MIDNRLIMGQRIKERRKLANLSQTELGNKIGVSFGTISKYESGDIKSIDATILNDIAKITNTDVNYFLLNTDIPNSEEKIQIAASMKDGLDISDMDEDEKKFINDFVKMVRKKNNNN